MNRLSRWSQRKRQHSDDARTAPGVPENDAMPSAEALSGEEQDPPSASSSPEPGSLDDTLPDPEDLPPGSDIKAFLVPGVSAGLRKRALRRLYQAPHYQMRDGLDDYDDDYRQRLKPLAQEVANRLRRWSDKLEESAQSTEDELANQQPTNAEHGDTTSLNPRHDGDPGRETGMSERPPDQPPQTDDDHDVDSDSALSSQGRVGKASQNG
ncbi:DUF3306 domain-containing protein [Aidingimonas halophila]|uniref:DUF3306 domain-containing protein n=1 Tax=Aidingimonas halophila TaxID=574349 RepID=A0A1H3BIS6_9GAMM|nr:DUF3306 domain-containing protein [Aidingimonas halophila]GHC26614.1 hypothetical protein GCM10008094_17470 [Aidingimonas halophila]SDX41843.1 Protein of unknown function [Aidingimonas halophila]